MPRGLREQQEEERGEELNDTYGRELEEAGHEAQGILKLLEQLKEERTELQDSLVIKGTLGSEGNFGVGRNMEVCQISVT